MIGVKALLLLGRVLKKLSCLCIQCNIMDRPKKDDSNVTSEASYDSDTEPSYFVNKIQPVIKPLGMDEYFSNFQNNDSDEAILA